jgi:peptidoglycan glycosyltransferase
MMVAVVEDGTGNKAQIDGYTVGGKTGTAQSGPQTPDHGWFIGFALDKNGTPVSAVCVELEQAGSGGSAEAARIAGRIMQAAVADSGGR